MDPDSTPESNDPMRRVADAIGNRTPIDWDAVFEIAPADSVASLRAMQELQRITESHDRIAEEFAGGPAAMLEGAVLSHYRVIEKLGEGGMGVVYRARDDRFDRDVALKVLHPDRFGDEPMRAALLREARLAGSLNHPNIATVYDAGEVDGYVYVAIECVDGSTLHDVAQGRPLTPSAAIDYGIQIASALGAAHASGIIHRDLKSRNICVSKAGLVKVLDFGIAASTGRAGAAGAEDSGTRGEAGSPAAGTLAYMAPEVIQGAAADARSDLWSLGVCLYEMLAGARPFVGASAREVERAILNSDPADLPASVGLPLRNVVSRCLHKEASRRYQSAGEVLSALEALRSSAVATGSGPTAPPPEPGPPEPWKPTWRHAVYGALATLLLVALVLLWPQSPRRHDPAVVVLPARNESGGGEQQYLADGLTDQLINSFAVLAHLRVLSRMTGDAMARKPEPLPAAARHYGFDYALETAVVRVGDRLRVHARLVDARSDRPIWVESYDREVGQIVTVDNEIVLGIVQKLKTPFSNAEAALLGTARPVDPAAFQAFTRGRTAVMERHYQPALDLFLEAARIDSTYASAYAGLADCYTEMAYYRDMDPGEALSRAVASADRALALDSAQADAHLAKALVYGFLWNWTGASQELRNAEADAPGSAQLHYRLSLYDGVLGRVDDAVRELERAAQLDPASPRMASELGLAYLNARKIDKAEREFERVMAWNDGAELKRSRAYHARCLALTGRAREAVTELTAAAGRHPDVFEREELAYALAAAGRAAESRRIVAELLAMGPGVASPLAIAAAQLTAGSRDAALETLLRACDQHDPKLLWLAVDQRFDPIRREPKYDMMIRAMGLDKPPPA